MRPRRAALAFMVVGLGVAPAAVGCSDHVERLDRLRAAQPGGTAARGEPAAAPPANDWAGATTPPAAPPDASSDSFWHQAHASRLSYRHALQFAGCPALPEPSELPPEPAPPPPTRDWGDGMVDLLTCEPQRRHEWQGMGSRSLTVLDLVDRCAVWSFWEIEGGGTTSYCEYSKCALAAGIREGRCVEKPWSAWPWMFETPKEDTSEPRAPR